MHGLQLATLGFSPFHRKVVSIPDKTFPGDLQIRWTDLKLKKIQAGWGPALRKLKMYDSVHDGNDRREQVHSKGDKTITAKGIPVVLLETIAREDSQNSQQKRCITN